MKDMVLLTYYMFTDLLGTDYVIEAEELMSFILTVKRHYRQVPYHNFEHAFVFIHCVYCTLKLYESKFDLIEVYKIYVLT